MVPEAAWCSACEKYVWVSPEGHCQFGHGPEFLSGRYVDGEPAVPTVVPSERTTSPAPVPAPFASSHTAAWRPTSNRPLRIVLALAAVFIAILIIGAASATWAALDAVRRTDAAANQELMERSQASDTNTRIHSGTDDLEDEPPATEQTKPSKPMTRRQWDRFIAKQYPGYRIKQRIRTAAPWHEDLHDMHYVLVNKRRPEFTLLVNLAQLTSERTIDDIPEVQYEITDSVASDDVLFSRAATREHPFLREQGQDAIIDAYLVNQPTRRSVVFAGYADEELLGFWVKTGSDAAARVVKDNSDFDYAADATIPSGRHNATVKVTVERL